MIVRIWTANVKPGRVKDFEELIRKEALPPLPSHKGFVRVLFTKDVEKGSTAYQMITMWEDLKAVKGYAGENWDRPRLYPREREMMMDDSHVEHFEVLEAP